MRTVVEPVFPPADAEIVTLPSFKARTRPVLLTVARFVLELAHVNVTPVMVLLAASYAVAVIWIVSPSLIRGLAGVTVMWWIGG